MAVGYTHVPDDDDDVHAVTLHQVLAGRHRVRRAAAAYAALLFKVVAFNQQTISCTVGCQHSCIVC